MLEKVQAFVIEFFDLEVIKASINTLLLYPNIEINIIENKSDYTDSDIKPYLIDLVNNEKIKRYFAFDKNIFNGASDIVLRHPTLNLNETRYCLLTDGSLSCNEPTWLQKQMSYMEADKNIYACAVSLSRENMPPIEIRYFGTNPVEDKGEYELILSGHTNSHMLLIRSKDIVDTLNFLKAKGKTFTDCALGAYRNAHSNRTWIRIKTPLFYRHTWDYFKIPNHPYMNYKHNFNMQRRFTIMRCGYTLYTKDNETRFDIPEIGI